MLQVFKEWRPLAIGDVSVLNELPSQWAASFVRTSIDAAIDVEAPIHPDRLAKIVAAAFGLARVNDDRKRAIQRVVPSDYTREDGEGFYWPRGIDHETWRVVRCPKEGASRPLEEISLIEIGNAMIVVAEQTGGIDEGELKREALNLFGGRRITQAISARLDRALEQGLGRGLLRRSSGGMVTSAGS